MNKGVFSYVRRFLPILIFCILPFILISSTDQEWKMRFFVLSFIFIAAFVSIILLVFNPKTNFMSRKAKLNQPGYEKAKKNVNIIIRIFILGMALLLLFIGIIPLVKDFMEYQKDNSFPQQIITVHKSSAQFGLSFFYQSLTIDEDGSTNSRTCSRKIERDRGV